MKTAYQRAFTVIVFTTFFGMLLVVGVQQAASQFGRFDLTSSKKYTLSDVTREILQEDGKIRIEVFASQNLPANMQYQYREIQYLLADYRSVGGSNIEIQYFNPQTNQARIQELGIQQTQFNTIGQDQYQVQHGYMALAIMDEDQTPGKIHVLDYLPEVNDLEYRLTYFIDQIKRNEKPKVGYLAAAGERNLTQQYQLFNAIVSENYTIETVTLPTIQSEETEEIEIDLSEYQLLFIVNPQSQYSEQSISAIKDYISEGGNVFYIGDTIFINPETAEATPLGDFAGKLFEDYGATVNENLVYDLESRISIPIANVQIMYPLITISMLSQDADKLVQNLPDIIMNPYTSSLTIDDSWTPLYTTSNAAGLQTETYQIDPTVTTAFPPTNLNEHVVIAANELESGGKLLIAGSSYLFEDQFMQSAQENIVLLFGLVDYAADGRGLSQITAKNLLGGQFLFAEENQRFAVNYIAPTISFALLGMIGTTRIMRRSRLRKTLLK